MLAAPSLALLVGSCFAQVDISERLKPLQGTWVAESFVAAAVVERNIVKIYSPYLLKPEYAHAFANYPVEAVLLAVSAESPGTVVITPRLAKAVDPDFLFYDAHGSCRLFGETLQLSLRTVEPTLHPSNTERIKLRAAIGKPRKVGTGGEIPTVWKRVSKESAEEFERFRGVWAAASEPLEDAPSPDAGESLASRGEFYSIVPGWIVRSSPGSPIESMPFTVELATEEPRRTAILKTLGSELEAVTTYEATYDLDGKRLTAVMHSLDEGTVGRVQLDRVDLETYKPTAVFVVGTWVSTERRKRLRGYDIPINDAPVERWTVARDGIAIERGGKTIEYPAAFDDEARAIKLFDPADPKKVALYGRWLGDGRTLRIRTHPFFPPDEEAEPKRGSASRLSTSLIEFRRVEP